jgi:hypothetical protein
MKSATQQAVIVEGLLAIKIFNKSYILHGNMDQCQSFNLSRQAGIGEQKY